MPSTKRAPRSNQKIIDRLCELAALVGMGGPNADETPQQYGTRILARIDPEDEFLDDEVRFRVLVLLNMRVG